MGLRDHCCIKEQNRKLNGFSQIKCIQQFLLPYKILVVCYQAFMMIQQCSAPFHFHKAADFVYFDLRLVLLSVLMIQQGQLNAHLKQLRYSKDLSFSKPVCQVWHQGRALIEYEKYSY